MSVSWRKRLSCLLSGSKPAAADMAPPTDTSAPAPADDVLLVLALDALDPARYARFAPTIAAAARRARTRLTVLVRARAFTDDAVRWAAVQRLLAFTYVAATRAAQEEGNVLLDVDVLLRAEDARADDLSAVDALFVALGEALPANLAPALARLTPEALPVGPSADAPAPAPDDADAATQRPVAVVALGGTFDHLHAGHKILLSMAARLAHTTLIVGVTDDALLQNKANRHVLEPLAVRSARVRAFVARFKPGLAVETVPLRDVAGPTGEDPDIQALVVSRETLSGGAAIDKIRQEKNLPPLETFVIDVISATEASIQGDSAEALKEAKMSSTYIREWIVKNQKA